MSAGLLLPPQYSQTIITACLHGIRTTTTARCPLPRRSLPSRQQRQHPTRPFISYSHPSCGRLGRLPGSAPPLLPSPSLRPGCPRRHQQSVRVVSLPALADTRQDDSGRRVARVVGVSGESAFESVFDDEGVVFVLGGDRQALSTLWTSTCKKAEGRRKGRKRRGGREDGWPREERCEEDRGGLCA